MVNFESVALGNGFTSLLLEGAFGVGGGPVNSLVERLNLIELCGLIDFQILDDFFEICFFFRENVDKLLIIL